MPADDYGCHYLPRSRPGWITTILFLAFFALTQPPFVYVLGNRVEPWVLGSPFLFVYLLALYVAMIAVLVWARRRNL